MKANGKRSSWGSRYIYFRWDTLKSKSEYWNGDIPWITTGDIHNIKRENITNFITEKGLNESSAKLITNEAILIAMYGQGKTRGMSAILNFEATT